MHLPEGLVGTPDANFFEAMRREFCESLDSDVVWKTGNYGIETTSRVEWHFVVNPAKGLLELSLPAWPVETKNNQHPRQTMSWGMLMAEKEVFNGLLVHVYARK